MTLVQLRPKFHPVYLRMSDTTHVGCMDGAVGVDWACGINSDVCARHKETKRNLKVGRCMLWFISAGSRPRESEARRAVQPQVFSAFLRKNLNDTIRLDYPTDSKQLFLKTCEGHDARGQSRLRFPLVTSCHAPG